MYKKLLGQSPSFTDLAEAQPALARGLQQLLDFEGDVEGTFCRQELWGGDYKLGAVNQGGRGLQTQCFICWRGKGAAV